jgi:hypothetical protein
VAQQTPLLPFRKDRAGGGDDGRRRPSPEPQQLKLNNGRAWINGHEVGGPDPRFAHLNRSYD